MPRWRVEIIRHKAEYLGSVEADSEQQALEEALKLFRVDPARANRLVVTRLKGRE